MPLRNLRKGMDFNFGNIDIEGWNWIDVTNHGVDNTGNKNVVPAINDIIADDTLLIFPSGEYFVPADEMISTAGNASKNFGMLGIGDATFVHASDSIEKTWLRCRGPNGSTSPVDNLFLKNFNVDYSAPNTGRTIQFTTSGGSLVEDITVEGAHTSKIGGGAVAVRCIGETSKLILNRFKIPDGAGTNPDPDVAKRPNGILIPQGSVGDVHLNDCHIEMWHDNGLYANKCDSRIIVDRCLIKNNGRNNVRIGSPGTVVRDTRIVLDNTSWMLENCNPVRVWENTGPVEIIRPQIEIGNVDETYLSNVFKIDGDVESVTVKGGIVDLDSRLRLASISSTNVGVDNCGVTFEDLTYKRSVDGSSYDHVIRCTRDNCKFKDMSIYAAPGDVTDMRGIRVMADNVKIEGGIWQTDDRPIWVDGGSDCLIDGLQGAHGTNAIDTDGFDVNIVNTSTDNIDSFKVRGTRPRWNGFIGGGPFGGVNLTTVHGRSPGDFAISDGNATDFPAGSLARWDGTSWQKVNASGSVTPA